MPARNTTRNTNQMKEPVMAKTPNPKFVMIGKGKVVHVVHTEAWDRKHAQCTTVRKAVVAGTINYKSKGLSPEAAMALDGCVRCEATGLAKANLPADAKRADAKEKRDDTLRRASGAKAKPVKAAKPKAEPKAAKEKKPSMTKSGPRSVASAKDGDTTYAKAKMLMDFATENGWKAVIEKDDDTGHTYVRATRGDEVITAWYIDGKYDINRHAETRVGSWTGKLRGAHACRRQMAGEGRDRIHPEPGKGRGGPRRKDAEVDIPEDESPEDAARRVPFSVDDDEATIIDLIKGKVIKWRNGVSGVMEEAWLPSVVRPKKAKRDVIAITAHPKTGDRILTFLNVEHVDEHGEHYGQERSVRLNKILKVADS